MIGHKSAILGQYTGFVVAGAFGKPLAEYIWRVSRYFKDVRLRVPKYIKTGDGGDNYYSLIMKKYWNPFLVAPLDHIKLPIKAHEVCIDVGGSHEGGIFSGKRPLSSIAANEKNCFPIPSNAHVGRDATDRYLKLLEMRQDGKDFKEEELLEIEALEIFMRYGVTFE